MRTCIHIKGFTAIAAWFTLQRNYSEVIKVSHYFTILLMLKTHLISNSVSKTDAGKTTLRVPDVEDMEHIRYSILIVCIGYKNKVPRKIDSFFMEEWKTIGERCKTYCEFVACFKYETCSG